MTRALRTIGAAILGVALGAAGLGGRGAEQASPADVRRTLDEARQLLDDGRPAKAKSLLATACADVASLAALERVPSGVRPLIERCTQLKDDLDLEGVDVSGITIPVVKAARPEPTSPATPPGKPAARPAAGISFTRQVAPLLVTHCGGCHVTGRKGGFQITSYDGLMKTGVVQRGVGDSSRLVEVIETGDMPRGGGKVSPQDLALIVAWINAGAVFDGADPLAALGQAGGVPAAANAGMAATAATAAVALKPGDVSFAFEIAPVLLKNCVGCHDDDDPEARLSMHTFARFVRGGESGAAFVGGRAGDSLLVRKIKGASGIEGQRMPIGKPPLASDLIALIEKWIDQGARLDMLGPNATLADLAAAGRARSLSHADLRQARFTAAEKLWRRALADETAATATFDDVIVIGNLPESRLDEAAGTVEAAAAGARKQLIDGDGPLLKGGVACLLFAKAYDYSNFRQAILGEERPKGLTGNAGVSGDVAYGAVILPARNDGDSDADLAALAAEQIAAAAFTGRGAPAWFAQGAGRTVAAKVAPKAAVVKAWKTEAAESLARLAAPEDFFEGHAGPVAQAAIGGGFVSALAPSPAKLQAIVAGLDGGAAFDTAFADVFKSPPQALFAAWVAKEARKPARR
jgi:mono/diheme cytochrome c family protein